MIGPRRPFCSICGGSTGIEIPIDDDRHREVCQDCGEIHYQNPKVIVGSVCSFNEQLLLCRRAIEPRKGYWTIPAGFMELGESAEEGAAREAWEEALARIAIRELIAVYSIPRIGQVQLLYRADILNSDIAPGVESLEVKLLDWRDIPWEELAFPSVRWVLRHAMSIRGQAGPRAPATSPVEA